MNPFVAFVIIVCRIANSTYFLRHLREQNGKVVFIAGRKSPSHCGFCLCLFVRKQSVLRSLLIAVKLRYIVGQVDCELSHRQTQDSVKYFIGKKTGCTLSSSLSLCQRTPNSVVVHDVDRPWRACGGTIETQCHYLHQHVCGDRHGRKSTPPSWPPGHGRSEECPCRSARFWATRCEGAIRLYVAASYCM